MTLVLLSGLSAGVLQDAHGNVIPGRQVNVYSRGTSTPVQVYADSAGSSPVTQPLTTSSSGLVPGYVAGNVSIDIVDVLTSSVIQAEPVSANTVGVSPGWGVAQTLSDRATERVSVMDNFSAAERADATSYTGSIDTTAKVQAIVDYLTARNGGTIECGPGKYLWNNLILKSGVGLMASGYSGARVGPAQVSSHQIVSTAAGWTIDTPSSASNGQFVAGFSLTGPGAGTSVGGIRLQNANRAGVSGCFINNYAEWGILQVAGLACLFEKNTANGCLLDRLRTTDQTTLPHGVIELRGTDNWVIGGEYTASMGSRPSATFGAAVVTGTSPGGGGAGTMVLQAGSSAVNNFYNGYLVEITGGTGAGQMNYISSYAGGTLTATVAFSWFINPDATSTYSLTPMRCFAGVFKGGDHWISDGIYEISEGGIYTANTGGNVHHFSGVMADQNSGPGMVLTGGTALDPSCRSNRSSAAVNGAYDDILILGGNLVSVDGATTGALVSDATQPRHGVHQGLNLGGIASFRPTIRVANRGGGRTGKVVKLEQAGQFAQAAGVELPGGVLAITSGTTPSLDGWRKALLNYAGGTTITSFTDLIDGVEYVLIANNGNATLQHGAAAINLISGANVTMSATRPLKFVAFNSVLYQL